MRLQASLVTLSGCETGLASVHRGDELVGLVRGFLAAGTSALITSLWTLNDDTAANLMAFVYNERHTMDGSGTTGKSLASTLRKAPKGGHAETAAPRVLGAAYTDR